MPMTIDGDGSITGLVAGGLPDNSITAAEIADGVITRAKVSTSEANSFAFCRAWVNFNGTGTVAIRADFNVTSITDNNTGDYTVNFTNAMPDANYVACATSVQRQTASGTNQSVGYYSTDDVNATTYSTTAVRISTKIGSTAGFTDTNTISVAIFR